MATRTTDRLRGGAQALLGATLLFTGVGHLTFLREDFHNQVPESIPLDPDIVVLLSGAAELTLGAALVATWKQPARGVVGAVAAAFFTAIFPGNIAQLIHHRDAFGLDSDTKRAIRLLFQPLLVAWALEATEARRTLLGR